MDVVHTMGVDMDCDHNRKGKRVLKLMLHLVGGLVASLDADVGIDGDRGRDVELVAVEPDA